MIEVGQDIIVRRPEEGYEARWVEFPSARLRDLLDEDEEERSAVLQIAVTYCVHPGPNFGDAELVWYSRPDVLTIQCGLRWCQPALLRVQARRPFPNDYNFHEITERLIEDVAPDNVAPLNSEILLNTGAPDRVVAIDTRAVFSRCRAGMMEYEALVEIIREEFVPRVNEEISSVQIMRYLRGDDTYRVEYCYQTVRAGEVIGNTGITIKEENFSREVLLEFAAQHGLDVSRAGTWQSVIESVLRLTDSCFLRMHSVAFHENSIVYCARYYARIADGVQFQYGSGSIDEARDLRRERIGIELAQKHQSALAKARKRKLEADVVKEKQVPENRTGLRSKRPDIIADDVED